jgi:hypothetical protein
MRPNIPKNTCLSSYQYLSALEEEVGGVHAGSEDIEFIHRARVASGGCVRRCRCFKNACQKKKRSPG